MSKFTIKSHSQIHPLKHQIAPMLGMCPNLGNTETV